MNTYRTGLFLSIAAFPSLLSAQPEDPLPRYLTESERELLRLSPLQVSDAVTPPPTGPVLCPGEYAPMDGVLLSYMAYSTIVNKMAANISTIGNAKVYMAVPNTTYISLVTTQLTNAGANMANVEIIVKPMNTVWIRDYGPRYAYEGDCRIIIDHTYNRPRPLDDTMPVAFGQYKNHQVYELPLIHGGGNYHLSSLGDSYSTQLIVNENPTKTPAEIVQIWKDYQNVDTTITAAFSTGIDATQHIDMWMQITGDKSAMVNDYPLASGQAHDVIVDNMAAALTAAGWTIGRLPALNVSGVHYTYANVTMCNDLVLVPTFTNTTVAPYNAQALAAWQAHMPGKTFVQVDCQQMISAAGVMHCICMHVPAHKGGANPTAYLRSHNDGMTLTPGSTSEITWISDDDKQVTSIDLLLSTDGGQTFPTTIASGLSPLGSHQWSVPNTYAPKAVIRVVATDAQSNTGYDDGDISFSIGACYADCDLSGSLDFFDFLCFQNEFASGTAYADCDNSGTLDFFDFLCFQNAFAGGCD